MVKTYTYNGKDYASQSSVRQAIWDAERKAFAPEPNENKAEFWAALGVTYEETEDAAPTLESLKQQKLYELSERYLSWRNSDAYFISSLGFEVDCDSRAIQDISGMYLMKDSAEVVDFIDHNNVEHELTAAEIVVIAKECTKATSAGYAEKWSARAAIEAAQNKAELNAVNIVFTPQEYENV